MNADLARQMMPDTFLRYWRAYGWIGTAVLLAFLAWNARKEPSLSKRRVLWSIICVSGALMLASRLV
jgi:hypothetical protein